MQTSSSSKLPTDSQPPTQTPAAALSDEAAARTASLSEQTRLERPDLVEAGRKRLGFWERFNLRVVRSTFEPGLVNQLLRFCQRTVGQAWIHYGTVRLRRVIGRERLFDLASDESVLVVSNHRSFFDLYVITAELVRSGLKKRIVFPVRSGFFYDSPLGFFVNLLASFLAMYPPIFRERNKAALNLLALDELAWLLQRGGVFAGLHPEGTRNRGDDPYSLLPAQPGVGRVIHKSRVKVVPVFVNGLSNDIVSQLKGNFSAKGEPIIVVFGEPVEFGGLLDEKPSPRVFKQIAETCMEAILQVAEEEKRARAEHGGHEQGGHEQGSHEQGGHEQGGHEQGGQLKA